MNRRRRCYALVTKEFFDDLRDAKIEELLYDLEIEFPHLLRPVEIEPFTNPRGSNR